VVFITFDIPIMFKIGKIMQTLHIHTPYGIKRIKSKFNIGQEIFVLEYVNEKPFIVNTTILSIGIESSFQADDLVYTVAIRAEITHERRNDVLVQKTYYDDQLFQTKNCALRQYVKNCEKEIKKWRTHLAIEDKY